MAKRKYFLEIGETYNRLTVVKYLRITNSYGYNVDRYECSCSCGNTNIVDPRSLVTGRTKSCGCYSKEVNSKLVRNRAKTIIFTDKTWPAKKCQRTGPSTGIYKLDVKGQWWYIITNKRTRAKKVNCEICGIEFPTFNKSKTCSDKCLVELRKTWINGEDHPAWKGGRHKTNGYIYVRAYNHPNKGVCGTIAEHRLVMEKMIGRYLYDHETVHHKNGKRDDNRPENLELWSKAHHSGVRVSDLVEHAIWVLKTYKPDALKSEKKKNGKTSLHNSGSSGDTVRRGFGFL